MRIHKNIPQVVFNLIQAVITVCFWGRATGKTEGPGGDFTLYNILTMPRSLGGVVSVSYDKLLTFILPKLIKSWERMGYIENVHFWVGKYAPADLNIPRPFLAPTDPKRLIHWYNGSAVQLLSLDRMGISNSADIDWLYADECKLFDYEKFTEVIHTNRGNAEHFGHLSNHHSVLLTTDRPNDSKGNWLYDIADNHDQERVDMILKIQQRIFELKTQIQKARTKTKAKKLEKVLSFYTEQLKPLRLGKDNTNPLVFCSEASTLDNVHALGLEQIKGLKRMLTDLVYRVSVLNERVTDIEDGFYKHLSDLNHGYYATNHDFLDNRIAEHRKAVPTCQWYSDTLQNEPLDIAMDHNGKINNIMTGQSVGKEYRFIHSMYEKGKYQDLLKRWNDFHLPRASKHINYFYDHTMVAVRADHDLSFYEEIIEILTSFGWTVNAIYLGQQPSHKMRYLFWEKWLTGADDLPTFRYNQATCEYWYERAKLTGTLLTKNGTTKDKRDEKKPDFPQELAPHITDAGDTLAIGAVYNRHSKHSEFTDLTVS